MIDHLNGIGTQKKKNWFLLGDLNIKTDRLVTLLSVSSDCPALSEEFSVTSEDNPGILMELLGQIQHPYIYPILDLNFFHTSNMTFACLVMPFNRTGSLKDLIYKVRLLIQDRKIKYGIKFFFRLNGTIPLAKNIINVGRGCP